MALARYCQRRGSRLLYGSPSEPAGRQVSSLPIASIRRISPGTSRQLVEAPARRRQRHRPASASFGTTRQRMPAARADSSPRGESSTTRHSSGVSTRTLHRPPVGLRVRLRQGEILAGQDEIEMGKEPRARGASSRNAPAGSWSRSPGRPSPGASSGSLRPPP